MNDYGTYTTNGKTRIGVSIYLNHYEAVVSPSAFKDLQDQGLKVRLLKDVETTCVVLESTDEQ